MGVVQLALRRNYAKKIDPCLMLVWLGRRTVQNMVIRIVTRRIGSDQYTLLFGRPVQTGQVLFELKFTTGIECRKPTSTFDFQIKYITTYKIRLTILKRGGGGGDPSPLMGLTNISLSLSKKSNVQLMPILQFFLVLHVQIRNENALGLKNSCRLQFIQRQG